MEKIFVPTMTTVVQLNGLELVKQNGCQFFHWILQFISCLMGTPLWWLMLIIAVLLQAAAKSTLGVWGCF